MGGAQFSKTLPVTQKALQEVDDIKGGLKLTIQNQSEAKKNNLDFQLDSNMMMLNDEDYLK